MVAAGWIAGSCAVLALLYFFLTMPAPRRENRRMPKAAYAHRGLHGENAPENSLPAFRLAAQRGYGVELDVHATADGQLVVMHDGSLLRMCGVDKAICGLTLSQVQSYPLKGTGERAPSLGEALAALAPYGTPLIVEMKSDPGVWKTVPLLLYREMRDYPGPWCVESFDPRQLRWFRVHAPQVIRGQLAFDPQRMGEKRGQIAYWLGARLLMNFLSRPDFIAYQHETAGNLSFRIVRRVFRPVTIAWTVRTKKDFQRLEKTYDLQIFEGFEP